MHKGKCMCLHGKLNKNFFVWDKVVQLYSVTNDHYGVREILCIDVHRVIAEIKTYLRWISFLMEI